MKKQDYSEYQHHADKPNSFTIDSFFTGSRILKC